MDHQEFRRKANKKLVTFIKVIIFVIRFKGATSRYKKRKVVRRNGTMTADKDYMNENFNIDLLYSKKSNSVKYQVIDNNYMKERFKGSSFTEA